VRTPLRSPRRVVAHSDRGAVVENRRAGHRQQQAVHQLDAVDVILQEGRQAAADADIDARARVGCVHLVHVVALLARDHLEGKLIVIAQEDRPLAVVRDVRRLLHDFDDGITVLLRDRHVHSRHQRKVIGHMALVAVAEIFAHVLWPLVRFSEQQHIGIVGVDQRAQLLQNCVRLREVFVVGPFALDEVRDRVETKAVHTHVEPEAHDAKDGLAHLRIVEVEIGLMTEEAMPVVRIRDLVVRPVRLLGVGEDDPRATVLIRVVAPHVPLALA
jgi:hypothetical protein